MKSFKEHNRVDEKLGFNAKLGIGIAIPYMALYLTASVLDGWKKHKERKSYNAWLRNQPEGGKWVIDMHSNVILDKFWGLFSKMEDKGEYEEGVDDILWDLRNDLDDVIYKHEDYLDTLTDPKKIKRAKLKATKAVENLIKKSGVLN